MADLSSIKNQETQSQVQSPNTENEDERSLITLIILNVKGVLAKIATFCSENNINIEKLTISNFKTDTSLQRAVLYVSGNRLRVNTLLEKFKQLDIIKYASNFQSNNYIERELMLLKILDTDPALPRIMDLVNEYSGNTILFRGHVMIFQFTNEEEKNEELTQRLENLSQNIEILKSGLVATSLDEKMNN